MTPTKNGAFKLNIAIGKGIFFFVAAFVFFVYAMILLTAINSGSGDCYWTIFGVFQCTRIYSAQDAANISAAFNLIAPLAGLNVLPITGFVMMASKVAIIPSLVISFVAAIAETTMGALWAISAWWNLVSVHNHHAKLTFTLFPPFMYPEELSY